MKKTPLIECHEQLGAKLTPFAGWLMPLHYGSAINEHKAVRSSCGIFDVSHMTLWSITDPDNTFLPNVFAGKLSRLNPGRALYSLILNDDAGIIDDALLYRTDSKTYCITNAGTYEQVADWFCEHKGSAIVEHIPKAIVAISGPDSYQIAQKVLPDSLKSICEQPKRRCIETADGFAATTGYTGEPTIELIVDADQAVDLWQRAISAGAAPCGLSCRDTLRLEAGLVLSGQDMSEQFKPAESMLSWTLDTRDNFIGAKNICDNAWPKLCGVASEAKAILRPGFTVSDTQGELGSVTSGAWSPTLEKTIGLARLNRAPVGDIFTTIRGRSIPLGLQDIPFYKGA